MQYHKKVQHGSEMEALIIDKENYIGQNPSPPQPTSKHGISSN